MRVTSFVPNEEIFKIGLNTEKVRSSSESKGLFAETLKNSLDKINEQQLVAEEKGQAFVRGEDVDISEVMLAGEEAKISLQYAVQVRNKLVEAYQEISRMQL
ncbi:flagellar hook-basal body complex protein FliE [Clostridium paraputrificum]|uniref:flagellar hook-basal body complex protein FliE n=1 Tax=Clostridium paraputrificum TaxID=29363 RepID=UPI003D358502